ncbi:hypothetical protein SDC9_164368 [bioreactor metagenome]|uniref:Cupin type-2 domain-containing protein n=1 Tax=bioreactor metagenome TaxID=1076179 RepID=A0A645FU55_9ZZZZ
MPIVPKILNWEDCEWRPGSREKIRGKCFQGENMTLQVGEICTGHVPGPHSHPYEQIVYIMDGECDFYVDGVPYPLSKGCLMSIPPNVEHYIVAKGDVPVINLDIFTPKRPDRIESVPNKEFGK